MKDRRDESEGMEKSKGNRKFSGNKSTDRKVKKVAKELGKKASPAKNYKSAAQRKAVHASKADGGKGAPAKMYGKKKSPAKKKGDPKKKKKSETYSNYKDFKGNMQKSTIDDSTFTSDSTKFKAGINPKYKLNMDMSYDYNKKNNPKAVEFTERMSPVKMSGRSYDMKEAYNKDLSPSARLHYLENERHDKDSPNKMYGKKHSPNKMKDMSPLEKELVGKQHNLPAELKAKIEASPAKMYGKKSPMEMSRELTYGGPVIDQEPKALSHMGASKVLRHMSGSKHSPLNMNGGPGKPKSKMAQGDTVRGFDNYKVGDMVSEDDFESKFKNKGNNSKNYPQLSVQDYSVVKKDARGKYVNRLKD